MPAIVSTPSPADEQLTFDRLLSEVLAQFRPLLKVAEAAALRRCSETQVREWIDLGTLRAVDISRAGEDASRRELRVYRYSLEAVMLGRRWVPVAPETILPHRGLSFRVDEAAIVLNCDGRHVRNLSELRATSVAKGTAEPVANCVAKVRRDALIAFLTAREIDPLF